MTKFPLAIGLLVTTLAIPAQAGDSPFGAGSLPMLATDAKLVIATPTGGSAEVARGEWATVYSVVADRVLNGDVPAGTPYRVAILRGPKQTPPPASLDNSTLFLGKPISGRTKELLKLTDDETVYPVLYGGTGIVRNESGRVDAIASYFQAAKDQAGTGGLAWAKDHYESLDPFLQASALHEAIRQAPKNPGAAELGTKALASSAVSSQNKQLAVQAIASTDAGEAVPILAELALDRSTTPHLMSFTLRNLTGLRGGRDQLERFSQMQDRYPRLAAEATALIRGHDSTIPPPPNPPDELPVPLDPAWLNDLKKLLTSGQLDDRRKGIALAAKSPYHEEIFRMLKERVENPDVGPVEKQESLGAMTQAGKTRLNVAEFLRSVIEDSRQPMMVRRVATLDLVRLRAELPPGWVDALIQKLKVDPKAESLVKMANQLNADR